MGAGLLGKSLDRLLHVEIGMRTDHLALYFTESLRLSVQISVPHHSHHSTFRARTSFAWRNTLPLRDL